MILARIQGASRWLGAPPGWTPDTSGPCAPLAIRDGVAGDVPMMESAWEPTPEELAVLNAGGKVYLRIIGQGHTTAPSCQRVIWVSGGNWRCYRPT